MSVGCFLDDDQGGALPEYTLMVAGIAVAIIAALTALGVDLSKPFLTVADAIGSVEPAP